MVKRLYKDFLLFKNMVLLWIMQIKKKELRKKKFVYEWEILLEIRMFLFFLIKRTFY